MSEKIPGTNIDVDEMERIKATLETHKQSLLSMPGCTGVAIGLKTVNGEETDQLAIQVFVETKLNRLPEAQVIPDKLNDIATDVVEQEEIGLVLIATDPNARHEVLFGGISVTALEYAGGRGSIGCFIHTPGHPDHDVAAGDYLLTCEHVLFKAHPPDTVIIQPYAQDLDIPENYYCGDYVYGLLDPTHDCAIAKIGYGRGFQNEVPNYPWYPGRRGIKGVAAAAPGQKVYKYGASTYFTEGVVHAVNFSPKLDRANYQNVTMIRSKDGQNGVWVAHGDSGSVTLLQANDMAIGLNFAANPLAEIEEPPEGLGAYPAYYRGFMYDLQAQMDVFSATGHVTLA